MIWIKLEIFIAEFSRLFLQETLAQSFHRLLMENILRYKTARSLRPEMGARRAFRILGGLDLVRFVPEGVAMRNDFALIAEGAEWRPSCPTSRLLRKKISLRLRNRTF
jgi:hypothetical protein